MKIIFNKYGGLKTIEDRQLLVQSSSNANYVDIYYQDENGNFADETVNLATIAFKRADSFEIMEKTCDAVREELTNKLLYFRYVFQEDDLAVNGELQITVRLKQVVFDPEDETQILLIKQRAMGKLVAHIYEAIGTDYEYYNVIDGRLLQLELWQSTFDGTYYDVTQIDAIVAQEVLNRNNAINDHNNNANAHASIREKIATNTDNIATNDERISELEDFKDGLNLDIGNRINQAVAEETNAREEALESKADLVAGKVPREQLPSYSYDEIIDKPVSVIFEITSFTELTPLQKTTITNQLMPLLNDNLTDLDTNKYSDLILRYLDERYHYSSVAVIDGEVVRILFDYKNEDTKIKLDINFVGDDSQTVIELVTINFEPEGTVSTHNASETAHSDIRQAITGIQTIIATIDGEPDADSVINKLHEIVALLNGYAEGTTLADLLSGKVDKVEGKGLSTNDLTNTLKSNYDTAYNHSQSDHAPTNAQKNSDITKSEIEAKLTGEISSHSHALPTHNHDDRYYTETEVDTKLGGKADTTHNHTKSQITDFPTSMTPTAHNHTKSEITDFPTIPTIPDISLNDDQATAGKYISKIEVDTTDKHKLNITKENLPTIPTIPDITVNNGSAESGKYISQIAVDATDKHKLNITKENLPTVRPTIELEVASLTTLTEAEKLAIKNTLSSLIVDDKIDGTKFDDIVLVTTNDLIRLHYSSIDYYVANPQITVIFETDIAKYILNVPVVDYTYSTLTSTTTNVPTISTSITADATSDAKTASPKAVKTYVDNAISTALDNLLGGSY